MYNFEKLKINNPEIIKFIENLNINPDIIKIRELSDKIKLNINNDFIVKLQQINKNITPLIDRLPSINSESDDYVEVNTTAIQELNNNVIYISKTIDIPIGKKKIRIKTSTFIDLIKLIFYILSLLNSGSESNTQNTTDVIVNLIQTSNFSHSSQKELLENLSKQDFLNAQE